MIKKAILKSFDSVNHKATVQIVGSLSSWLENVPVSQAITAADMVAGRSVAVLFLDPGNPADCVVVALWPGVPSGGGSNHIEATFTNKSGAASAVGYVYRLDPDNNDSFDYASEDEDAQVIVTPTVINNNASGSATICGYTDLYVNGTTERGDYLYFSSTSGQAKPSKSRTDGCFGIATAARTGAGLVKAYVYGKERIRKWGWADEQGWDKTFYLPLAGESGTKGWQRYSGNPILTVDPSSSSPDYQHVCQTTVVYKDGIFYMFYTGINSGLAQTRRTRLATSSDGKTFTKQGDVLLASDFGAYTYMEVPCVMW